MDYSLTLGYSLGNADGVSKGFYSSVVTFAAPWTWVVSTVGVGSSRDRSTEILVKARARKKHSRQARRWFWKHLVWAVTSRIRKSNKESHSVTSVNASASSKFFPNLVEKEKNPLPRCLLGKKGDFFLVLRQALVLLCCKMCG